MKLIKSSCEVPRSAEESMWSYTGEVMDWKTVDSICDLLLYACWDVVGDLQWLGGHA